MRIAKGRKPCPSKGKKRKRTVQLAVKVYRDGREVCQDNAAGDREYKRRTLEMAKRQRYWCRCGANFLYVAPTFGHDIPRGLGGGFRDDRIEIDGKPVNHAECWTCNMEKGSKRLGIGE